MKVTPAQKRLLKELIRKGGRASRYDLGFPRRQLVQNLSEAGLINYETVASRVGRISLSDLHNCDLSITERGRMAVPSASRPNAT